MQWECSICGFKNKAINTVCGGTGAMGCKAPNPSGGSFADLLQNSMQSFGAVKGKGRAAASPYSGGKWACSGCGFSNNDKNQVCGGGGPLGCKAPRGTASAEIATPSPDLMMNMMGEMMKMMSEMQKSNGGKGSYGKWKCPDCGFSNNDRNDICGGTGPMGCNRPRIGGGGSNDMKGGWTCAGCGFTNRAQNTKCGGDGPMGCKSEKPSDWVCDCGFVNKPQNDVCGGKGPMGCKKAKKQKNETAVIG
mmetsp:Transcript_93807/g.148138  ORF Transcript_93807/g.148138 Transcript_93807/m.148138 type:complete len:248 (+) Transcript_93807:64-807(+)